MPAPAIANSASGNNHFWSTMDLMQRFSASVGCLIVRTFPRIRHHHPAVLPTAFDDPPETFAVADYAANC